MLNFQSAAGGGLLERSLGVADNRTIYSLTDFTVLHDLRPEA